MLICTELRSHSILGLLALYFGALLLSLLDWVMLRGFTDFRLSALGFGTHSVLLPLFSDISDSFIFIGYYPVFIFSAGHCPLLFLLLLCFRIWCSFLESFLHHGFYQPGIWVLRLQASHLPGFLISKDLSSLF